MITAVESVRYELRSKDSVKFTFERQTPHERELQEIHERLEITNSVYRTHAGTLGFVGKHDSTCVHVADMFAYEVRKDFERQMDNPRVRERYELRKLKAEHKVFIIRLCEKKCLEEYLAARP